MASRNQLFGIDQKKDEPRLEYDQNDNLLSREESIRRLFWMFFGLGFILASGLLFFIIIAFFLSVTGPQLLPSYEIEQKLFMYCMNQSFVVLIYSRVPNEHPVCNKRPRCNFF